jgi:hypothetical protein
MTENQEYENQEYENQEYEQHTTPHNTTSHCFSRLWQEPIPLKPASPSLLPLLPLLLRLPLQPNININISLPAASH